MSFHEIDSRDLKITAWFLVMATCLICSAACFAGQSTTPGAILVSQLAGVGLALLSVIALMLLWAAQRDKSQEQRFADDVCAWLGSR